MSDDLVVRVAAILDEPCGHFRPSQYDEMPDAVVYLRDCPVCLPKRVAAAIEAGCVEAGSHVAYEWAWDKLPRGRTAALAALKGDR